MRKNWLVAVAIGAMLVMGTEARAASADLGGTEWDSTNNECGIDEIDFDSDGSAQVFDFVSEADDTGQWSVRGNRLHIDYDTWEGGIDGQFTDGTHIAGTETWRDEKTHELNHDECDFELNE